MVYQDLTTFTEVDPDNHWAQTATRNTGTTVAKPEDSYVYKDYTANYFDDWLHALDVRETTEGYMLGLYAITNTVGSFQDSGAYSIDIGYTAAEGLCLWYTGGLSDNYAAAATGTTYYLVIERSAGDKTTVTAKVYSDAARTVLLDTLTEAGLNPARDYQYLQVGFSRDSAGADGDASGYCENLDLAYVPAAGVTVKPGGNLASTMTMALQSKMFFS